jgi:hypothetical protein
MFHKSEGGQAGGRKKREERGERERDNTQTKTRKLTKAYKK